MGTMIIDTILEHPIAIIYIFVVLPIVSLLGACFAPSKTVPIIPNGIRAHIASGPQCAARQAKVNILVAIEIAAMVNWFNWFVATHGNNH